MTEIKLISLCLENFKNHRHLRLDFNGRNAVISGDNATGKTSVYDGLMWLLFNKDSAGNGDKNFEVKPLDSDGNVLDHNALTSVEAVFSVNGENLTLLRTFREKWETRRGSSEAVFTGNTSEYTIDGVPVKSNAFKDKVNELVSEDTFRLLTNTTYFANDISWQERRAVLFKVAGVMDDSTILATNEKFTPLVESMGKLNLEDYKKKLLAEKRKFVGAKTEIPARISECQKTIEDVKELDFAGAKAAVEALNAQKDGVSAQLAGLDNQGGAEQKSLEIRGVQMELDALERENRLFREQQITGSVDVHSLNMRLTSLGIQMERKKKSVDSEQTYIADLVQRIENARSRWFAVNGEIFNDGNCPTCGQTLPAEQLRKAMERFEADKQQRLTEIEKTANSYKEAKAQAEDRLANTQSEALQMESESESIRNQISAAEAAKVEPVDMTDYSVRKEALQSKLDKLNEDLCQIHQDTDSVRMKLRQEMSVLNEKISHHNAVISKESLLDYSRQRVEQLRQDAKNAAECLESIEKMLYLIDEYSRYKTKFVEDSINGLFRIARFRLFREQANGGIEDRCDVVYDGIPYISVNNGMKINLGIDIINTLSAAYGVRVPLFVDNAESVTNLEKCGSQIIRLVVSENDKELRINYEN